MERLIFHISVFLLLGSTIFLGFTTGTETRGFWVFDYYLQVPDPGILLMFFMVGVVGTALGGMATWKEPFITFKVSSLIEKKYQILSYGLVLKLLWLFLIWFSGFTVVSSDDLCRLIFGHSWSLKPFFATWDFVWLAGQFYLYGLGEWMGFDPLVAARFFGILAGLGVVVLGYEISNMLFGRKVAILTLLVLILEPHLNWMTLAPLPGIYFALGVLWTAYCLIRWYGRVWGWLWGSFGLLLASTMRHEALSWVLIFWGLMTIFFWYRWKELKVWEWVVAVLAAIIPIVYFSLWFYFCAKDYGSPFHFMAKITEFTYEFKYTTTSSYRAFYYGNLLLKTTPFLVLFGLGGIVLSFVQKGKVVTRFYSLALVLFALGMQISILRGAAATNLPWRVFLTPIILIVPLALFFGAS